MNEDVVRASSDGMQMRVRNAGRGSVWAAPEENRALAERGAREEV